MEMDDKDTQNGLSRLARKVAMIPIISRLGPIDDNIVVEKFDLLRGRKPYVWMLMQQTIKARRPRLLHTSNKKANPKRGFANAEIKESTGKPGLKTQSSHWVQVQHQTMKLKSFALHGTRGACRPRAGRSSQHAKRIVLLVRDPRDTSALQNQQGLDHSPESIACRSKINDLSRVSHGPWDARAKGWFRARR
jgi:hypothetical protein